jgi:hypothetical protein
MFQPDLFTNDVPAKARQRQDRARLPVVQSRSAREGDTPQFRDSSPLDLPAVLERLAGISKRPRYTFMVLNLIARAAGSSGSAGPYIREGDREIPLRDWLSGALMPMANRDARRRAVIEQVRDELIRKGALPADPQLAEQCVTREVRSRLLESGRTNVSRAVSDLVRAGLLRRHYQGYAVNHENRGAQREAVYTIMPAARSALGRQI